MKVEHMKTIGAKGWRKKTDEFKGQNKDKQGGVNRRC